MDPLTDDYAHYTPYQYAGNEPIANVDVDGLEPAGVVGTATGVVTAASELQGVSVFAGKAITKAVTNGGNAALHVGANFAINGASAAAAHSEDSGIKRGIDLQIQASKQPQAVIKQEVKNWKQKLRDGNYDLGPIGNGVSQILYGTVDDFWVFAQMYLPQSHLNPQHFGGGSVSPTEKLLSAVSVLSTPLGAIGDVASAAKNGSTAANRLGQKMHKAYKVGADGIKEFRLPSGNRIDFLNIKNSTIYELKPLNTRAMKAGKGQLIKYMKELQTMPEFKGINWKTILDTY